MRDDNVKRYKTAYAEDRCAECGSDEYVALQDYERLATALRAARADLLTETRALEKAAECRSLNGSGDIDYWLKYFREGKKEEG